MTRERKILVAVAAVAAVGVMADRLLMGGTVSGPQDAEAATVAASPAPANGTTGTEGVTPSAAPKTQAMEAPAESLGSRLERVRPQLTETQRNAFSAPPGWRPADEQTPTVETVSGFNPESFARRHPLEAVTTQGSRRSAVVAGTVVTLGETREGMTLTAIDDAAVIWSGHGVRVRVRLHPR